METDVFDVVVIGSGPGGYVAAIRASQLGLKTACIEKNTALGGTCLNVGCIPSKALLQSTEYYELFKHEATQFGIIASDISYDYDVMQKRKDAIVDGLVQGISAIFKRNRVESIKGTAQFISPNKVQVSSNGGAVREIEAKNFILATGSAPIELPFLPFDEKHIVSSTGALSFPGVPKELILIGAGVIGVELASVYRRLGSEVTAFEMLDRICPAMDTTISKMLLQLLKKQGLKFHLSSKVIQGSVKNDRVFITVEVNGRTEEFSGDAVLVAVGRKPYTQGLQLDKLGITLQRNGSIPVDGNFRTVQPHIYAIGDLIEGPMLAHRASEEGIAAAEIIAGMETRINYMAIPNIIYTHPEVASVGFSEDEAKQHELQVISGSSYFRGNPRARCMGYTEGMVKVVAEARSHRLVGLHILGPYASEMIGLGALAINRGATLKDIVNTSHAHPTLSEAILDSCLSALGRPIHA